MAEGAPLLREYGFYSPSRVRIPLSPPNKTSPAGAFFIWGTGRLDEEPTVRPKVIYLGDKANWTAKLPRRGEENNPLFSESILLCVK